MNQNDSPALRQQTEQFVVFSLDDEEYAVSVLSVAEVVPKLEITPFPDAPDYIIGLVNLRGKILPVLELEKKFHLSSTISKPRDHIMVTENEQKIQFGILVDQVKEILKVPGSSIQSSPEMLKTKIGTEYLPGVIVLDGGKDTEKARMILILDIPKILSDTSIEQLHELAKPAKKQIIKQPINEGVL